MRQSARVIITGLITAALLTVGMLPANAGVYIPPNPVGTPAPVETPAVELTFEQRVDAERRNVLIEINKLRQVPVVLDPDLDAAAQNYAMTLDL